MTPAAKDITVREVTAADAAPWLRMRCALWPDGPTADHRADIANFLAGEAAEPEAVLLALAADGSALGFAELSIRAYAEGCRTQGVAYLEGWYVDAGARRRGVGVALIRAAEEWARSRGCREFASDAHPDNAVSIAAHAAAGFEDVGLIRCFRKTL